MKPRVFIGSSVESLDIADAIQENLDHYAEVTVWDQGVFELSSVALIDLLTQIDKQDFGIFIFKPDDIITIRTETKKAVRDNVLFELGLFMGKLGKDNVFFVTPESTGDLHLPSDLWGVVKGRYNDSRSDDNLVAALGTFCNQVKRKMRNYTNSVRLAQNSKQAFSNIFGSDVLINNNGLADFTLVIPKLTLNVFHDTTGQINSYPYLSSDGVTSVRVDSPVPLTEVESMIDLSAAIVRVTSHQPKIKSDAEVFASMDLSYCTLGGVSSKTPQILKSSDNIFYEFNYDTGNVIRDKNDHAIRYELNSSYDYAIILKIHPRRFPNRVQICVAGMDTWGTRGACYFLANKWQEIEAQAGSKAFGAVIEVERGILQSAELKAIKIDN